MSPLEISSSGLSPNAPASGEPIVIEVPANMQTICAEPSATTVPLIELCWKLHALATANRLADRTGRTTSDCTGRLVAPTANREQCGNQHECGQHGRDLTDQ